MNYYNLVGTYILPLVPPSEPVPDQLSDPEQYSFHSVLYIVATMKLFKMKEFKA